MPTHPAAVERLRYTRLVTGWPNSPAAAARAWVIRHATWDELEDISLWRSRCEDTGRAWEIGPEHTLYRLMAWDGYGHATNYHHRLQIDATSAYWTEFIATAEQIRETVRSEAEN